MKIAREQIIEAALALLNETGVDKLSTRALAERLGVQQPALYWHFKNKRALLDALNDAMLAHGHIRCRPLPGEAWDAFLRNNMCSFRRALLAWRDGARVHVGTEADPERIGEFEPMLALLGEAGMSPVAAMQLLVALSRYTVGCVLEEQADQAGAGAGLDRAAAAYPLVAAALADYRDQGHEAYFDAGLALLLDGARLRLQGLC